MWKNITYKEGAGMNTVNIKINGYDYTMKHGITILDA